MADSLPLGTAVESVPIPIARLKSGPKSGVKSALSDDVRLKLAQHINSELEIRHVLLIQGKRNKSHVMDEHEAYIMRFIITPRIRHKIKSPQHIVEISMTKSMTKQESVLSHSPNILIET